MNSISNEKGKHHQQHPTQTKKWFPGSDVLSRFFRVLRATGHPDDGAHRPRNLNDFVLGERIQMDTFNLERGTRMQPAQWRNAI